MGVTGPLKWSTNQLSLYKRHGNTLHLCKRIYKILYYWEYFSIHLLKNLKPFWHKAPSLVLYKIQPYHVWRFHLWANWSQDDITLPLIRAQHCAVCWPLHNKQLSWRTRLPAPLCLTHRSNCSPKISSKCVFNLHSQWWEGSELARLLKALIY